MQEKDVARIVKELITNVESKIEAIEETEEYKTIAVELVSADSEEEVERILLAAYKKFDIKIPWKDDFDTFMANKENGLVFS